MGLLDDAIKEHLELKRRRGADPSEISRQESEALGPVRRGEVDLADRPVPSAAPIDEPAFHDEPVAREPGVAEPDGERGFDLELERAEPESEADSRTPPHGDPLADEASAQPTQQFSSADLQAALGSDDPPASGDHDVVPGDESDADGDVLEGTPEFLEETPEHDRLWFEQKPPKDFDF